MRKIHILLLIILVIACGVIAGLLGVGRGEPQERDITIKARKYAFEPGVIRINRGDKVTLKLFSVDVTHGFYLEGYDFDAKLRPETPSFWIRRPSKSRKYDEETVESYTFVANKAGKFRYRCSIACGGMHPFMQGELIVSPNYLFPASIGLVLGMALAFIIYFWAKKGENDEPI